jgi:hypothetical protein
MLQNLNYEPRILRELWSDGFKRVEARLPSLLCIFQCLLFVFFRLVLVLQLTLGSKKECHAREGMRNERRKTTHKELSVDAA